MCICYYGPQWWKCICFTYGSRWVKCGCLTTACLIDEDKASAFSEELNEFYARFDKGNQNPVELITCDKEIDFGVDDVAKLFNSLNVRKSCGPDYITPRLLKTCSNQLSHVYFELFSRCITDHIPSLWKTATIVQFQRKLLLANLMTIAQ